MVTQSTKKLTNRTDQVFFCLVDLGDPEVAKTSVRSHESTRGKVWSFSSRITPLLTTKLMKPMSIKSQKSFTIMLAMEYSLMDIWLRLTPHKRWRCLLLSNWQTCIWLMKTILVSLDFVLVGPWLWTWPVPVVKQKLPSLYTENIQSSENIKETLGMSNISSKWSVLMILSSL